MPFLHEIIHDKLYLSQGLETHFQFDQTWCCFQPTEAMQYDPYCDDFGPVNMGSVIKFVRQLEAQLASFPLGKVVFTVEPGRRPLTNAVFLVGAYLMLRLKMPKKRIAARFSWLDQTMIEPFRDPTYKKPDFELSLDDCWGGLERGMSLGWIRYASKGYLWGQIDVDEYCHYDRPLEGNMHEVVPGKLFAFQGPKDLGDAAYRDDAKGMRDFSPSFYADILLERGVTAVVRLNESLYDPAAFVAHGIAHHHLEFDDCTCPPDAVVSAFLRLAAATPGAVAVHCKAGLGRTGTLIARYMMEHHGFAAREAIGWLRIMRPGSVIGEQQHYLCEAEAGLRAASERPPTDALPIRPTRGGAAAAELAAQVGCGAARRAQRCAAV